MLIKPEKIFNNSTNVKENIITFIMQK